jgi:hypothetical protein
MSTVVHLKWGERPPAASNRYLIVTRQGRIRGEDFYVRPSEGFEAVLGEDAYASLTSALKVAETVAAQHGVETIYVRLN